MKNPLEKLSIHPRDFVRLKGAGKSVADMTAGQKLVSQAKNYGRVASRDARGMRRAKRLRKNIDPMGKGSHTAYGHKLDFGLNKRRGVRHQTAKVDIARGAGLAANQQVVSKATKYLDTLAARQAQWQTHGARSRRDTAMRVGAAALGTAGAVYGVKAYRKYRDKAREKTMYRKYGVVKTAHGHVAVGKQVYNQPYYNEVEPRHVYDY